MALSTLVPAPLLQSSDLVPAPSRKNLDLDCPTAADLLPHASRRGRAPCGPGSKKCPGLRFEANPLPSWASFPLPNGTSMQKQDGKMGRFRRNPSVHQWEEFAMRNVLIASCLGS